MHVPARVVTNSDLEKLMDTSDAWIVERTGIRERRWVEPGTGATDLALAAGRLHPKMNGRQVFKHATMRFPEVIQEALALAGHTPR